MAWSLFRADRTKLAAESIFAAIVAQARAPALFMQLRIADSIDGRFDSLALHMFMVLRRLKSETDPASLALSQALCDRMIDEMDRNLREMGVSDLSVGRRVRQMAEGFYGRLKAYDEALDRGGDALIAALLRNLYGSGGEASVPEAIVAAVADYTRAGIDRLAALSTDEIFAAQLTFADLPVGPV